MIEQREIDLMWLERARIAGVRSQDPSTKCGAIIVSPNPYVSYSGYNALADGVAVTDERLNDRDLKYEMIVHAEVRALIDAYNHSILLGKRLSGFTLYTHPFMPCSRCAAVMIEAGVSRVVAPEMPADKSDRWAVSMKLGETQFREAGVVTQFYRQEELLTR